MWQLEWAGRPPADVGVSAGGHGRSAIDDGSIAFLSGLMWEEHCHECAEPDCYESCPLFVRRADGRCARFEYGIVPNAEFSGIYPFGADIRFRRWGKLESVIPVRAIPVSSLLWLHRIDQLIGRVTKWIDGLRGWPMRYQLTARYRAARIHLLKRHPSDEFDEFLVECWSPEKATFRLIIEGRMNGFSYFRESVPVHPGWNTFSLPAKALLAEGIEGSSRLLVYPENDATVRTVFTYLDFVRYSSGSSSSSHEHAVGGQRASSPSSVERAAKVKCVVWDLDNTLWEGILADDGVSGISVRPRVRELISALDRRGIVQSISSKNDFGEAWSAIEELGLADMFLSPAINWGPKSAGISSIARDLNIGTDSLAFIDDSPAERAEVSVSLPEVLTLAESEIDSLLDRSEFDAHPSEEGRRRRLSYLADLERRSVRAESPALGLEEFLRSCDICLEVSVPSDEPTIGRCHELLMRSNQLNLTTRRYTLDEMRSLLTDSERLALAVRVHDKYGDYGLVGFVSIARDGHDGAIINDFVFSCRVAKKYVENAVIEALRETIKDSVRWIRMTFVPTSRNEPLLEVLRSMAPDGAPMARPRKSAVVRIPTSQRVTLSEIASDVWVDPVAAARLQAMFRHQAARV